MTANKKYLKQLNANLTCSPANQKKFIDDITPLLNEFSNEHPQAGLDEYIHEFGTPEALASSLLSALDQEEVYDFKEKKTRKKRNIMICITVTILLIFIGLIYYIHTILIIEIDFESNTTVIDKTKPDVIYESTYNFEQ